MEKTLASEEHIISHKEELKSLDVFLEDLEKRSENLALPLEDEKKLLTMLFEFELGRFLLKNKGLDGYWTSYIISNSFGKKGSHPLEDWILNKAPVVLATRERFGIFQKLIGSHIKKGAAFASIPCGVMDDLLTLDPLQKENLQLVGIDLDGNSLKKAQENSKNLHNGEAIFLKKDAWNLGLFEEFDLITSNGINIYEPDEEKTILLYREFYKALRPNGILITSFLTPPPSVSKNSTWKNFSKEDLLKQKAVFGDIIQAHWQVFRTEKEVVKHLEKSGFKVLKIVYDSQGMFPTIVAQKVMKS
jgi:SAM-dependent methyltransferase